MESLPPSLRKEGWKRRSSNFGLRRADSPGGSDETQVLAEQALRGLRICIPGKLPGDISAAVVGVHSEQQKSRGAAENVLGGSEALGERQDVAGCPCLGAPSKLTGLSFLSEGVCEGRAEAGVAYGELLPWEEVSAAPLP